MTWVIISIIFFSKLNVSISFVLGLSYIKIPHFVIPDHTEPVPFEAAGFHFLVVRRVAARILIIPSPTPQFWGIPYSWYHLHSFLLPVLFQAEGFHILGVRFVISKLLISSSQFLLPSPSRSWRFPYSWCQVSTRCSSHCHSSKEAISSLRRNLYFPASKTQVKEITYFTTLAFCTTHEKSTHTSARQSIPTYVICIVLHMQKKQYKVKKILSPCHSKKAARILDSGKLFNLLLDTFDSMKAICLIFEWSFEIINTQSQCLSIKWQTLGPTC